MNKKNNLKNIIKIKRSIAIIGSTILITIVGYLYFLTLPQYSLLQINKAFRKHNLSLANKYIDIEGLSNQVGDEMILIVKEEIYKNTPVSDNSWEALGQSMGKAMVENLLPAMSQQMKNTFKQSINNAIEGKDDGNTTNSNMSNFKNLTIKDILPGGKVKITKDKNDFLLSIPSNSKTNLVFRMKKDNGKWRIVTWNNLKDFSSDFNQPTSTDDKKVQSKTAKFGDRIDISNGWFLTVSKPEAYTPSNQFDKPDTGSKLIAVEVIYENSGKSIGGYDVSNLQLKDDQDHQFKNDFMSGKKKPELESGDLPENQKVRGYLTFEVPVDSTNFSAIYSSHIGGTVIIKQ